MFGDGGRGSILTASPFSYSSTIGVPAANMVPVPGTIRGTRGLRVIRKKRNACFYMEPRIRFYTRTYPGRKFKNEATNRWGKKGPS